MQWQDETRRDWTQANTSIEVLDGMAELSERVLSRLLSAHGLTAPQVLVLSALHRHGPDLSLPELASITQFPLGAVTAIMDRLLVRGLVERGAHPGHGQWVSCTVTPKGRAILDEVATARREVLARLVDNFTDAELRVIGRLADRLEDELERELPDTGQPDEPREPPGAPFLRVIRGSKR